MGDHGPAPPLPPPDNGGIRPPRHAHLMPDSLLQEILKSLMPLDLTPTQTTGVLKLVVENAWGWMMPYMTTTIEDRVKDMEKYVHECVQQVAADGINAFGAYALSCVAYLMLKCKGLEVELCRVEEELRRSKDFAIHLLINQGQEKTRLEEEKKKLAEELEVVKRRMPSSPETYKRGSSKRKGDPLEEFDQRQTIKKTAPSKGPCARGNTFGTIRHLRHKVNISHLIAERGRCSQESMKLPQLEAPPLESTDIDMKDAYVNEQDGGNSLPSVAEEKTQDEESAGEAGKEVYASRNSLVQGVDNVADGSNKVVQPELSVVPAPSEQGENEKTKSSIGEKSSLTGDDEKTKSSEEKSSLTSGPLHSREQNLLITSSHLVEDSQSGAHDTNDGNIQASPDSEKPSHEQEIQEKLRKSTSDGFNSSFSTSKQGSEEGDNVQSVCIDDDDKADDGDKADSKAALALCTLVTIMVASEPVKDSDDVCIRNDALVISPTNHCGSNFPQDNSHQAEARKKKKSTVRPKSDLSGPSIAVDEGPTKPPDKRQPSAAANKSVHDHRPLITVNTTVSEDTVSRDQRRVYQVARQLLNLHKGV